MSEPPKGTKRKVKLRKSKSTISKYVRTPNEGNVEPAAPVRAASYSRNVTGSRQGTVPQISEHIPATAPKATSPKLPPSRPPVFKKPAPRGISRATPEPSSAGVPFTPKHRSMGERIPSSPYVSRTFTTREGIRKSALVLSTVAVADEEIEDQAEDALISGDPKLVKQATKILTETPQQNRERRARHIKTGKDVMARFLKSAREPHPNLALLPPDTVIEEIESDNDEEDDRQVSTSKTRPIAKERTAIEKENKMMAEELKKATPIPGQTLFDPNLIIPEENEYLEVLHDYGYTGFSLQLWDEEKTRDPTKRRLKGIRVVYGPLDGNKHLRQVSADRMITISRHMLASIDHDLLLEMISGNVARGSHVNPKIERVINSLADRMKTQPSIYAHVLSSKDRGLSPTVREFELVLAWLRRYAKPEKMITDEHDEGSIIEDNTGLIDLIDSWKKQTKRDDRADDETYRRYLATAKNPRSGERVKKLMTWIEKMDERCGQVPESDKDKPLPDPPLNEVGYAINSYKRLKQHASHVSSNWLMNLVEATCASLLQPADKYRMRSFVVCYCYRPMQGVVGEVIVSRMMFSNLDQGGVNYEAPGGSNRSSYDVSKDDWDRYLSILLDEKIYLLNMRREYEKMESLKKELQDVKFKVREAEQLKALLESQRPQAPPVPGSSPPPQSKSIEDVVNLQVLKTQLHAAWKNNSMVYIFSTIMTVLDEDVPRESIDSIFVKSRTQGRIDSEFNPVLELDVESEPESGSGVDEMDLGTDGDALDLPMGNQSSTFPSSQPIEMPLRLSSPTSPQKISSIQQSSSQKMPPKQMTTGAKAADNERQRQKDAIDEMLWRYDDCANSVNRLLYRVSGGDPKDNLDSTVVFKEPIEAMEFMPLWSLIGLCPGLGNFSWYEADLINALFELSVKSFKEDTYIVPLSHVHAWVGSMNFKEEDVDPEAPVRDRLLKLAKAQGSDRIEFPGLNVNHKELLFAWNPHGNHWVAVRVFFQGKTGTIEVFDSRIYVGRLLVAPRAKRVLPAFMQLIGSTSGVPSWILEVTWNLGDIDLNSDSLQLQEKVFEDQKVAEEDCGPLVVDTVLKLAMGHPVERDVDERQVGAEQANAMRREKAIAMRTRHADIIYSNLKAQSQKSQPAPSSSSQALQPEGLSPAKSERVQSKPYSTPIQKKTTSTPPTSSVPPRKRPHPSNVRLVERLDFRRHGGKGEHTRRCQRYQDSFVKILKRSDECAKEVVDLLDKASDGRSLKGDREIEGFNVRISTKEPMNLKVNSLLALVPDLGLESWYEMELIDALFALYSQEFRSEVFVAPTAVVADLIGSNWIDNSKDECKAH